MTMTHEQWREHQYYKCDPFADEIQPALLNNEDIKKYIKEGCLVNKSDFDDSRLKTASYEMRLLGELHDWITKDDGILEPRCRKIMCGDAVRIPRNSITYLWMREKLLLPQYIAARFNLHIRHVHKGILLGTGPLIDPGFFGSLLIPLHNLTNNDYELDGGEGIIWVEFTKLSSPRGDLKPFPPGKDIKSARVYMNRSGILATGGVQSAFKGALEEAKSSAEIARKEVGRFRNMYTWAGLASAIAIVISLASVMIGGYNLVTQVTKITTDIRHQIKIDQDEQSRKISAVQENIADLEANIDRYKNEVEKLTRKIDLMKGKQEADRKIVQ